MSTKSRVLLIDDEPDILEVLTMMLERDGYQIICANDGVDALRILAENKFDIVVCDYLMPRMDGITLLKKVRENKDLTPFIFFSGNADDSHGHQMANLGAFELVSKAEVSLLPITIKRMLKLQEENKIIDEKKTEDIDDFIKLVNASK